MYWGRHVDVLVKSYRKDGTLKLLLRQRQYPSPAPTVIVLELQDNRTREEARQEWEWNRNAPVKFRAPNHVYANGLPNGWVGVFKEKAPRLASPLVQLMVDSLYSVSSAYINVIPHAGQVSDWRVASVYSEGDTIVFYATMDQPEGYEHIPITVAGMSGDLVEYAYQHLVRPVYPTGKVEVSVSFTFV